MLQQQSIIVPQISSYPDPEGRARKVLRWLSQQRIVEPQLSTCVAGGNGMVCEGLKQKCSESKKPPGGQGGF